jgi:BASS family bile acid:Na+ symporter
MDVAALLGAVFNVFLVVMIVSTMLSAGFTTTVDNLVAVLRRFWLVIAVLAVGLALRPIAGWLIAELFSLDDAAFIALVLLACVPGAPLGVKFVMAAKAAVTTGAALQVLLAVVGSFTFAPVANLILGAADIGDGVELPVWDILKTVVVLQIVPFAIGMLTRFWVEDTALEWNKTALKVSGPSFLAVVALAILGSWQTMIDLIGSAAMLAGIVFAIVALLLGYVIATGDRKTREATGLVQIGSNAGPVFAAIAIAFDNDPAILGAAVVMVMLQIIVAIVASGYFGKDRSGDAGEAVPTEGEDESPAESTEAHAPSA